MKEILEHYEKDFKSIPEDAEWIIGIDEAGRGPVLGPMVYGAAFFPKFAEKYFKAGMGFDDSKKLSETVREILFRGLKLINNRVCSF